MRPACGDRGTVGWYIGPSARLLLIFNSHHKHTSKIFSRLIQLRACAKQRLQQVRCPAPFTSVAAFTPHFSLTETSDTDLSVAALPVCLSGSWRAPLVYEEKRVTDLYVCGLDLSTGRIVQADEREVWEWHRKGHNGDRTLVCLECYHGAGDPYGKPQAVPLVPRGRIGGIRRKHFAHPPGMTPVGGHSLETAWHWEVKHRLCRWARESAGASAAVEAWTADGRRRSDVAVTFPNGARLAIEVQLAAITDTELLARRRDYARVGIALAWIWHPRKRIPHVLFQFSEPGWAFDVTNERLGLACGRPHARRRTDESTTKTWSPHWPPCPGDEIDMRWMPVSEALLTESGLLPSQQVAAELKEEAAEVARRVEEEEAAATGVDPVDNIIDQPDNPEVSRVRTVGSPRLTSIPTASVIRLRF
jgi:hypothetical protein